jgi:hypothetical protein
MSITWKEAVTPGGHTILDCNVEGPVSGDEMTALIKEVNVGGKYAEAPLLTHIKKSTDYSKEARAQLNSFRNDTENPRPVATVVDSAALRVFIKAIFFISGSTGGRVFETREVAIAWLDGVIPEWKKKTGAK